MTNVDDWQVISFTLKVFLIYERNILELVRVAGANKLF